jgi:peptidyl-prolyl cis-trans isomerase A (cyclophilin A)
MLAQTTISAPEADANQAKGRKKGLYAALNTSMGRITIQLFERESPLSVENFVDLALGRKQWRDHVTKQMTTKPIYNGTVFHRVIPQFMIQGGDPTGTGRGNPGFTVPDEWTRSGFMFNVAGRVAMANFGPGTANSQFFITSASKESLNEAYTIFGQVVDGMSVVNKIASVRRDKDDRPLTPVILENVEVFRVGEAPEIKK